MRFQVSQVMDAIEQRLTTDVTGAQAVVDLGQIVRHVALDDGRPVNLVRIGMVVDAFARYLLDGGAMIYAVAERALLSEPAFTSKERMVLSRWADDGLIEVVAQPGNRAAEVADLTGLPLVVLHPDPLLAKEFGWPEEGRGRMLRLTPRYGIAVLTPADGPLHAAADGGAPDQPADPVVGRAKVPESKPEPAATPEPESEPSEAEPVDASEAEPVEAPGVSESEVPESEVPESEASESEASESDEAPESEAAESEAEDSETPAAAAAEDAAAAGGVPAGFADPDPARVARVRISRYRAQPAKPSPVGASVLARQWRCGGFDCPAFGEHRQIGQPVPRMRQQVPVCPRHDQPLVDAGPRPPAYPVSIVVDDLPRRRLVVRSGQPVSVGRDQDDPDVVSVGQWLHRAASDWISPVHLRLEARPEGLVVTDSSRHGTIVWQRTGPDDPGTTRTLRRESHTLGEWDSVELYTGIELARGDRRPATVLGRDEPASVLVDAPTAAHRQVRQADRVGSGG